mmetsp:Transcript_175093/g.556085  ORF Transcript_175093/g.556085 Transcript_175093/m.556085 type:complete len:450 (+) Transcript_175093:98-1447(+)
MPKANEGRPLAPTPRYAKMSELDASSSEEDADESGVIDYSTDEMTSRDTSRTDRTEEKKWSPEEQLEGLKAELEQLMKEEDGKAAELARIKDKWSHREGKLLGQLKKMQEEIHESEDTLWRLEQELAHGHVKATGPKYLSFVDGFVFNCVVAVVILFNIIGMTMSLTTAKKASFQIQVLDDCFVAFYVVELLLRLGYYRKSFFFGDLNVVWWHWLDLFLVIDGIVFGAVSLQGGGSARMAGSLQYLRILRYLRVVKLVHTVFESNLAWTESDVFQTFIMAIICLNAIVMGAEVQHPELKEIWRLLEHLFLLIFSFELAVRMRFVGCRPFLTERGNRFFNVLDFTIVVGGIIDQWLLPLFLVLFENGAQSSSSRQMSSVLRLVRVMRLLRILRLLRLIRNVPPLYTLIVGILKAMQGMSWVMLLTVTVLYIAALLGVKLWPPWALDHAPR